MILHLINHLINTSDLQYFIPFAEGMNESVWLSGKIAGTVSELRGRILIYRTGIIPILIVILIFQDCQILKIHLYILVSTVLKPMQMILKNYILTGKGALLFLKHLNKLGNISFDGSFTGFTTDFVTYGKFRTSQGNIRTDISLRPEKSKKYRIKGLLNRQRY